MRRQPEPNTCDVAQTIRLIGGKWKAIIVFHLIEDKVLRFSQLQRLVPDITQRMLTLQLRELEQDGLVARKIYQEVPPRVEYSLTPLGTSLTPIIASMKTWGHEYKVHVTQAVVPLNV
jgi:DNA-binding HxlR family transcriptional regulator